LTVFLEERPVQAWQVFILQRGDYFFALKKVGDIWVQIIC